jgi:hypothetical protein
MNSSRHTAALSTAFLIVLSLMATVPFKSDIANDVSRGLMAIARR